MIRGQANQPIGCNIRSATTGAAWTTPVNVWVKGDLNAAALGTVGGGSVTPDARGYAEYVPSAAETQYGHLAFTFDAAGAIGDTVQVQTISPQEVSALQTATGLSSVVVNQLLLEALIEIRMGRAGDSPEPELLLWALGKLNRMLDKWNADPSANYTRSFTSYTPTTNHAPHSIGPNSADWTATVRPDRIIGANVSLNTVTPAVRIPIAIRDEQWWLNQAVRGLATALVTDLYYAPAWPNGEVNLWPIPTMAYPIELLADSTLGRYAMTDTLWLPFGYREAITLTLAELCAVGCGQSVSPELREQALDARVVVFGNNLTTRNIRTRDGGMPGGRRRGSYLYRTGRTR